MAAKHALTAEQFNSWRELATLSQADVAELLTKCGYPIGQTAVSAWSRSGVPLRAAEAMTRALAASRDRLMAKEQD